MRLYLASSSATFRMPAKDYDTRATRNFLMASLLVSLVVSMTAAWSIAADASKLQINSPVVSEGATIPTEFTCSGANQSPALSWNGVPPSTKSLALILADPDAPSGTFVHWVVYDIPPSSLGFKAGAVDGKDGLNSAGRAAYMGPCPPPGKPHHYHFSLFALDSNLNLEAKPDAQALRGAMNGHVIQSAELVGIFGR
jgi:Raf kinase inhibitor-like YbhB/YbcL family protein